VNEKQDTGNGGSDSTDWWDGDDRGCTAPTVVKTQTYSRGNNDLPQMQDQRRKALALAQVFSVLGVAQFLPDWFLGALKAGSYQYETVRFRVLYSVDPSDCVCNDAGGCDGDISVNVSLTIRFTTPFPRGAKGYVLVCGPDAKRATTDRNAPGHAQRSADVQIDEVTIPAAKPGNAFVQPNHAAPVWVASASCTIPCSPGTYAKRFYLVRAPEAGGAAPVIPGEDIGLIFFIDCIVEVTKPRDCELDVKLRAYLLEFRKGYDFTHGGKAPGADAELPQVQYTTNEPPRVVNETGTTNSIAKLIEEDGVELDHPFLPKLP
jgi:hypothetical protein